MKNVYSVFLSISTIICLTFNIHAQVGTLTAAGASTKIICSGTPSIVLSNMHFANNASNTLLTAASSEFRFIGELSNNISSTGQYSTMFYNTEINKTGGAEIDITTDNMAITTSNILEMVSGNVDMNDNFNSTWTLGTSTTNLGILTRTTGHFYRGFFQRWYPSGAGTNTNAWDIPIGRNSTNYN